jgi:ANTAR domain
MDGGETLSTPNGRHYRVAQAVAVVSAETDCTVDEALLVMQEEARANGQTLEEVANRVIQGLTRFRARETAGALATETMLPMPQHQYEARCVCGMRWRIYRDEDEEDPTATCIACGEDTHDLGDIGKARAAGPPDF